MVSNKKDENKAKKSIIERFSGEWRKAKGNADRNKESFNFWYDEIGYLLKNHWKKILISIPLFILFLWAAIVWVLKTDEIVTITGKETKVTDVVMVSKVDTNTGETINVPKNIDTYFVYTDKGAFQFKESWFFLQFEVADSFGRLEENKTYKITHYGFRVPIFDWFENIVDFEEYTEPKTEQVAEKNTE